jgi:hypothetical protein
MFAFARTKNLIWSTEIGVCHKRQTEARQQRSMRSTKVSVGETVENVGREHSRLHPHRQKPAIRCAKVSVEKTVENGKHEAVPGMV